MRSWMPLSAGAVMMWVAPGLALAASCESVKGTLKIPDVTINMAATVDAGKFERPDAAAPGPPMPNFIAQAPAFCRVTATARPSNDSEIQIEVWIPSEGWNGKFQGEGNGGFAGSVNYDAMAAAVTHGYATAGTDTGHIGSPIAATWALNHPEKVTDFGWRAIHLMTATAKAVIAGVSGKQPQHSFFAGCSNGGRQALMEAQRFPADYDGIIAGAPANYWTRLLSLGASDVQALQ